jgi:adenine C2-methylase RlmN of 23S rRNA A2503 and tRNA A37
MTSSAGAGATVGRGSRPVRDLTVIDCVRHDAGPYRAKDFDTQRSYRISLELVGSARGKSQPAIVEVGVYLHWKDETPVDIAVDLSCMSGCSERCVFCAAAQLNAAFLTPAQIVAQAEKALQEVAAREDFRSFGELPTLTFSFEGMGEPSRRAKAIVEAVSLLRETFAEQYRLQFIVSTTAADPEALRSWAEADLGLQSLQLSLHGATRERREELLGIDIDLDRTFAALADFHAASPVTEIKLNYLVLSGRNDSDEDVQALRALLAGKPYFLKIARLNETEPATRAELRRPPERALREFAEKVAFGRPPELTYLYGSEQEIQISCGQLASYARGSLDESDRRTIREIYDRILDGKTILFLGAGASSTFAGSGSLARRFYQELGYPTPFEQTEFSLRDVVDFYEAKNRRREVAEMLREAMEKSPHPPEFLWLTLFPWKAIYTTNYDQFVERAYEEANDRRLSEYRCVPVTRTEELSRSTDSDAIRLVKLHGCISHGLDEIVLSGSDYVIRYLEKRDFLFKMLEADALRYDVLFAGYSFRDEHVGSRIATLRRAAGRLGTASHAILPESEWSHDQARILEKKFSVGLIPMSFKDFLRELVTHARQPIVYIAGSKKSRVVGVTGIREDFGARIEHLARILGSELSEEGIRVVTGATATDKVGYLVASAMDERLVTTYSWQGAQNITDREIGDEPAKMINVREVGFKPSHVIDKMALIAQAAIFIGGGPLTVQEFYRLHGHGRFVIPVALGDATYASDIIHSFLRQNAATIDSFNADRGLALKEPHKQPNRALTRDELDALHLGARSARSVADTILQLLREFRFAMPEADLGVIAP